MPFWKWILCLLGGFFLFSLLYGLAQLGTEAIRNDWVRMVACVGISGLALLFYSIWTNLTERRPIVGLMALAGSYRITGAQFHAVPQLAAFLSFLVVAVFEEIIFRGVIFRLIDDRWNTVAALVVSALIFGFVHYFNPGGTLWSSIAISIEAGLLLAAAYKYSGTLWLPIGIHWAWNYVQGNVLGFAVSGNSVSEKIFSPIITGPNWLNGGAFGAEASVPAVVIGILLTVILLVGRKPDRR